MQLLLILSRKKEEAVLIGRDIKIKVVEIEGDRVKIGIDAPKNLKILREELYDEVSEENIKAVKSTKDNINDVFELL